MKVSYKWLQEYVDLSGVSPFDLADKLTRAGIEVEGVEPYVRASGICIARVISLKSHPESDHLNIAMVDDGQGLIQVVCGAKNIREDQRVILARVGANLDGKIIEKGLIKNQESNGMLCSIAELGINNKFLNDEDINGIAVLDMEAPLGIDPIKYLGLDDYILDVSLTPNRADCMSVWALAKEIGAILRRSAKLPNLNSIDGEKPSLKVESLSEKCPKFLGRVINNIVIKESPKWMKDYLHSVGIKSINNIVDISNFVMVETGQPLHFYDKDKFENLSICVRDDIEDELETLDGIKYQIQKKDLVITSDDKIVGLAGIMGSESSKIEDDTKSIIIEAALFNNVSIRNTANRLSLATEASTRFIKGIDPLAQVKAMTRATNLLIEYASASGIEEVVSYGDFTFENVVVEESLSHCNKHLGTSYSLEEVKEVLEALDFKVEVKDETFICSIPSYRTDIRIAEDLDEEIIRLLGYDSLKTSLPTMVSTVGLLNPRQKMERLIKTTLVSAGLSEVVTYSLVKEDYINEGLMADPKNGVKLLSPISDDRKFVRNSLMPSLMECVAYNQNRKSQNINIFEISNVYENDKVNSRLAIGLNGNLQTSKLYKINIKDDFYTLKGIIESVLEKYGINQNMYRIESNNLDKVHFHPYRSACIYLGNNLLGIFGQVHPTYGQKFKVSDLLYGEIDLDLILATNTSMVKFKNLNKYPSVSRDIALLVNKDLEVKQIENIIKENGNNLVSGVEVFDIYTGENIDESKKSVALNIKYESYEKTLTETEVSEVHTKILDELRDKLEAVLRT